MSCEEIRLNMITLYLKRPLYSLLKIALINAAFAFVAVLVKKTTKQEKRKLRKKADYFELARSGPTAETYLTPAMYCKLRNKITVNGFSMGDLLTVSENGCQLIDEDENIVLVKDAESYEMFQALIESLIYKSRRKDCQIFRTFSLQDNYIKDKRVLSCTMSANRNLYGFGFPLNCSSDEKETVAKILIESLLDTKDLNGHATSVAALERNGGLDKLGLQEEMYAIRLPMSALSHTKGRWIWCSNDRKSKVYINFRDHVAVVVAQMGGNLGLIFDCCFKLVHSLELKLKEMKCKYLVSKRFGCLTSLLCDAGRGFRVEVKVKFLCLNKDSRFKRIIHALPIECLPGVDALDKDVFVVSNLTKVNSSEVEILQEVTRSIVLLLELDKRIRQGENVKDILP